MNNIYNINGLIFNVVLCFMIFYSRNLKFMQPIFVEKIIKKETIQSLLIKIY